jgi:hypothetical protein
MKNEIKGLELKLVQYLGNSLHEIRDEITRWREILEVPYQEYLRPQSL